MKIKKFKGTIYYKISSQHPDVNYLNGWFDGMKLDFSDTYYVSENCPFFDCDDEIISYIKNDLMLVAGGGYNTKHIYNVSFNIVRVF